MEILGYELSPMYLGVVVLVVLGALWWWWSNRGKEQKASSNKQEVEEGQRENETESRGETMTKDTQSQDSSEQRQRGGMLPGYGSCQ